MGYAYLRNGERIDYRAYIENSEYWQKVRAARFEDDGGRCVVCHEDLHGKRFETHHISYTRLGQEHRTDVITLCPRCHTIFHNNWQKSNYWKGKEPGHWEAFSLEHTARMCLMYYKLDKFICKDADAPNLCNTDVSRSFVDQYFKDMLIENAPRLDPHDFELFVRNKRYELLFEAEERGLSVEEFLDECYGKKIRGQNPIRRDAGKYFTQHTLASFHKHYAENKNINILMQEVKNYAETE